MSDKLPSLNLKLHTTDNPGSPYYAGVGQQDEMTGVNMEYKTPVIYLVLSKIALRKTHLETQNLDNNPIQIPYNIYKLTYSDTFNNDQIEFELLRDHWKFHKKNRSFIPPFKKSYQFLNNAFQSEPTQKIVLTQTEENKWANDKDVLVFEDKGEKVAIHLSEDSFSYTSNQYPCNYKMLNTEPESLKNLLNFRKKLLKIKPNMFLEIEPRKNINKTLETNKKGEKI